MAPANHALAPPLIDTTDSGKTMGKVQLKKEMGLKVIPVDLGRFRPLRLPQF